MIFGIEPESTGMISLNRIGNKGILKEIRSIRTRKGFCEIVRIDLGYHVDFLDSSSINFEE